MNKQIAAPAIAFDLDGTLIDSLPDIVDALNVLLDQEARPPISLADGRRMVGEGAAIMVERAFAQTGEPVSGATLAGLTRRYVAHYHEAPVKKTGVFPGVVDVLTRFDADGIAMGVCTNKPHGLSVMILEELGISRFFRSVVGGDVLAVKKPDAAHVFAVLDQMGARRDNAVLVGDSPTDMATARNAGLPAIAVSYGYSKVPAEELDFDVLIERICDLPEAISSLLPTAMAAQRECP